MSYISQSDLIPANNYWREKRGFKFSPYIAKDGTPKAYLGLFNDSVYTSNQASTLSYSGNASTSDDGGIHLSYAALAMGKESDTIRLAAGRLSMTTSFLSMGAGDDNILAIGGGIELSQTSRILLGGGANRLTGEGYYGIFASGEIEGGAGKDTIIGISTANNGPWSLGALTVPAGIKVWDNSSIRTYSGSDTIKAEGKYEGLEVGYQALIDTGSGRDRIVGSSLVLLNGTIHTGPGDDIISSPVYYANGASTIDMGDGIDRLALKNGSYNVKPHMDGFLIAGNAFNNVTNGLYVTGVEFIGGLSGEWQDLREGSYDIF